MKKTSLAFAAFAALALSFVSCQKESATLTFSAHTETNANKTTLNNDNYFVWESGDQVKIFSTATAGSHATFTAEPVAGNPTWANLTGGNIGDAPYTAIFPASIAVSASEVELPKEQVSTDGSLRNFPMYTTSSTSQLLFTNLCAAICIKLPEGSAKLSRIDVVADQPVSGRCTIDNYTDNKPYAKVATDGNKYVSLSISAPTSNTNNEYCITLPAGVYNNFEITMYDGSGNICRKSVSDARGLTLVRNTLNTIQFTNVSFATPRIARLKYHAFSGFGSAKEIVFHYNSNVTSDNEIQNTGSEVIYAKMNGDVCDVYTPADYIYAPENASELFSLATENSQRPLEHIDFGYYFRTNETTSMNCMFYAAENLVSLDLSTFNTERVSDMGKMFEGCENLTKLDLTSFNSNSLTLMYNMFFQCTHLSSIKFNSVFNAPEPDWGVDPIEGNFLAKNLKRACDRLGTEVDSGCKIHCNTVTHDRLMAVHPETIIPASWANNPYNGVVHVYFDITD